MKKTYIALYAVLLISVSCEMKPADGFESRGIIQIGMGGRYAVDITEALARLRYEITLSGPGGVQTVNLPAGSSLRCAVEVVPGSWTVSIKARGPRPAAYNGAYFPADMLRAYGTAGVQVPAGQTAKAEVLLYTATEVSTAGQLAGALANAGAAEELIFVTGNISSPAIAVTNPALSGKHIRIRGQGTPAPEIRLSGTGSLFTVGNSSAPNITVSLENITLRGAAGNDSALVYVDGSHLVMNRGAAVTGNDVITSGARVDVAGGVLIDNAGTFIMNAGEISYNTVTTHNIHDNNGVGGVCGMNGSSITLNGGEIRDNRVTGAPGYNIGATGGVASEFFIMNNGKIINNTATASGPQCHVAGGLNMGMGSEMHGGLIGGNSATNTGSLGGTGGGVLVAGGNFLMDGGEISANTATHARAGGGIRIINGVYLGVTWTGILQKHAGGTIYGADAPAALRNTANGSGNAVTLGDWTSVAATRTNTAGPADAMDSTVGGPPGGWD
ncbi:MAG: hypothetical protein LBD71_00080 [Treponema sp.]|jgi:hypothetical protein|nr:hypothetical protein [Treponema sp.]